MKNLLKRKYKPKRKNPYRDAESFEKQLEVLYVRMNTVLIKNYSRKIDIHFSGLLQKHSTGPKKYLVNAFATNINNSRISFNPEDIKSMYGANIILDI